MTLTDDSNDRKNTPIYSGVLKYFPLALAAVARVSKKGNEKHNPGEPLHWSRDKSDDHLDCAARHLTSFHEIDYESGELHGANGTWRMLAELQISEEKRLGLGVNAAPPPKSELPPMQFAWSAPYTSQRPHGDVFDVTSTPAMPPPAPFTFWYLATPFTKYPAGREVAFHLASDLAAQLMLRRIPVFSPIAHTHPISQHMAKKYITDHDLWMQMDAPMMHAASGLIVVMAESWEDSKGVREEIKRFYEAGKPVVYWPPECAIPQEILDSVK